jgi:hypothetical protein
MMFEKRPNNELGDVGVKIDEFKLGLVGGPLQPYN